MATTGLRIFRSVARGVASHESSEESVRHPPAAFACALGARQLRDLVDDLVSLTEAETIGGIRLCNWQERQNSERSGTVCVAPRHTGKTKSSSLIAALLSGGNTCMNHHHRVISGDDVDIAGATA